MPSLFKRNGTYYLQFFDERRSPPRRQVSLHTARKRDAEAIERRLVSGWTRGLWDPWTESANEYLADRQGVRDAVTFEDALSQLLESKERQGCTENTLRTYRGNVRRLGKCASSDRIDRLTPDEIEAYVRDPNVSEATHNKRYRTVRAFLRFCVKEKLLARSPLEDVDPVRAPKNLPNPLPRGAVDRICGAIRKDYREKRDDEAIREGEIVWMAPLVRWAAVTGMRFGECARLRWGHIDLTGGIVRIPRTKSREEQTIPLHSQASEVLDLIGGEAKGYVFAAPKSNADRKAGHWIRNVGRRLKPYFKSAGVGDYSFHSLRHTFCTRCVESGLDPTTVKELARHKALDTTMRYVRLSKQHLSERIESVSF
jgi:integrase